MNTPSVPEETAAYFAGETSVVQDAPPGLTYDPSIFSATENAEAPYRYLFEANPQPMWIYDNQTLAFLLVNHAAQKHYGYSQEEFLRMTILDIRPPEDVSLFLAARMGSGGNDKRGIWRHRKKNGEIIEVSITAHDFRFRDRAARLTLINDVTEWKRIERALQQSELEQRMLADHLEQERARLADAQAIAKVGSWEQNLTTGALFWSEETYRIFGVDPLTEVASHAVFRSRVHPDDMLMQEKAFTAALKSHTPYACDHRLLMPDGSIKIVHERCRILYDEGAHPLRALGTVQDITESRQAEIDLQHIMEGAHCLLWQAEVEEAGEGTLRWKLQFASEQAAQRFLPLHVSRDLDYALAWYFSRPQEDRERNDRYAAAEIRACRNYQQEFRCRSKDGELHWLSESVRVEALEPGRWRCIGVCTDVTEQKRAEEERDHVLKCLQETETELRRSYAELEKRVVERTTQLTESNARLLAAKREAEEADRTKSEFLSRMSHELRTPLNAILGFGQILERQALTPLQEESLRYILTGGRHLLDLINEILDVSRVEAGQIELSIEPLALSMIVSESCALIGPMAAERKVQIEIDPQLAESRPVLADHQRLKQALINLLSNGIKYNRSGGTVRIASRPADFERLQLAVQDTGPGITPEEQKRLFVPFERLSAPRSGVEGTGLGLVLTRHLVTAMGGDLTLESVSGEGSTFLITLPCAAGTSGPVPPAAPPASPAVSPATRTFAETLSQEALPRCPKA